MSETTENAVTDTTPAQDVTVDQASTEQKTDLSAQTAQQEKAVQKRKSPEAKSEATDDLIPDASKEAAPTDADTPDPADEPTVAVKLNREWYDAAEAEGDVTVSTATGTYALSDEPLELPASEAELILDSPAAERA